MVKMAKNILLLVKGEYDLVISIRKVYLCNIR